MRTFYIGTMAVACVLLGTAEGAAETGSLWTTYTNGNLPDVATSIGLNATGRPVYVCRGQSEGEWQLGLTRKKSCVHPGERRDTVHLSSEVLSLSSDARWQSVRGVYRGNEAVDIALRAKPTFLCRVRQAGRTRVGLTSRKGCRLIGPNKRLVKSYELLVDPYARTRNAYRSALGQVRNLVRATHKLAKQIRKDLASHTDGGKYGKPNNRQASSSVLNAHLKRIPRHLASTRSAYLRIKASTPLSHRELLQRMHNGSLEPALRLLVEARGAIEASMAVADIRERCLSLSKEVRDTVDLFTSDSEATRRLPARQRISVLEELQKRLNQDLQAAHAHGDRTLYEEIDRLFKPLPALLSDAIYYTQPWLRPAERLSLYSSFVGSLSIQKAGSASKGLRRLLELFRVSDPSVTVARAVDTWLAMMDDIAASIEQRGLPTLPSPDAAPFTGSSARTFAANLRRNGFLWSRTELEPDELDSGQTSRYLISPDLTWIVAKLSQKIPLDVIARVSCLRHASNTSTGFAAQLRVCDTFRVSHPTSSLTATLDQELRALLQVHAGTLEGRSCSAVLRRIRGTSFHKPLKVLCSSTEQRKQRRETKRQAVAEIRALIQAERLKAARSKLKRLVTTFPNSAIVFQIEYELKRARRAKAERLSSMKYASRLQSIEARLPALEETCSKSVRDYRRARKRMRVALRRGNEGRAAQLRLDHDRAFFRACAARDQVNELLSAQETSGLVQATRVTRETARTCLRQWAVCDRKP
jgi:hypothetical protein